MFLLSYHLMASGRGQVGSNQVIAAGYFYIAIAFAYPDILARHTAKEPSNGCPAKRHKRPVPLCAAHLRQKGKGLIRGVE